jgi:hypothetical protein
MAVKQYGPRTNQNTRTYFASTTDLLDDYPTDCEEGSAGKWFSII